MVLKKMRFATFEYKKKTFPGVLHEDLMIKLSSFLSLRRLYLSSSKDLLPFIGGADEDILRLLREELASLSSATLSGMVAGGNAFRLKDARLRAPLPRPQAIFCLGFNYRSHAPEFKRPIPEVPVVFMKPSVAVVGPDDDVVLPKVAKRVDYEVELAVVMGKGGRYIPRSEAYRHIFGYTVLNDITARDIELRDFSLSRPWLRSKGFDTFAPLGPFIVTQDEIGDPMDLELELMVNGEIRQRSNTREMIFNVPAIVEYISSFTTFEPGSIIATGTPEKIGQFHDGDVVEIHIEKIGTLRNRAVQER
jgi:2-keto-4-pentenoate hydratase/2-oxohepta-3-ene-1,7-dioic acid hydratase in catechol pathway